MVKKLLSETELRSFELNNTYRQRFHAGAYVAAASIILDARAQDWYKEADVEQLRNRQDEQGLEAFQAFFTAQVDCEELSWEMSETLGLRESVFADTKTLMDAWINEITTRRSKDWLRQTFNL